MEKSIKIGLLILLQLVIFNAVAQNKNPIEPEWHSSFKNNSNFKKLYNEGILLIEQNTNRAYTIALDLQGIAIQKNDPVLSFLADYFLARCHFFFNQTEKAVKAMEKLHKIAVKQNWPIAQARLQLQMGLVFQSKGNFTLAEKHFKQAISIAKKANQPTLQLDAYSKLGYMKLTFGKPELRPEIESYFRRGLREATLLKDTMFMAEFNMRMSMLGEGRFSKDSVLYFMYRTVALAEKTNAIEILFKAYKNMGDYFYSKEQNDSSLNYYKKAYVLRRKTAFARAIAVSSCDLAYMYGLTGKMDLFKAYADTALYYTARDKSGESGFYVNKWLGEIYKELKDDKKALYYYKKYARLLDSSLKSGNNENIASAGLQSDFDAKVEYMTLKQQKENEIKEKEKKNQQFLSRLYLIGLCAFLLLSIIIFREFRVNKRQKKTIQEQHKNVNEQKIALEVKNKEITDSINYALRIQSAILPSTADFLNTFKGSFLVYQPKDIVSGDFYWYHVKGNYTYVACGDCTGHGVPGALMSVLGINLLNDIVESEKATEPSTILDLLRDGVIKALNKEVKRGEYKDGMDISLVKIHNQNKTCTYAGAHNSIYHIASGQLTEYKANKQPVGYNLVMNPFTQTEFKFETGDTLVLFTDGFADQFGEQTNKKFTYKKFRELLIDSISQNQPVADYMNKTFTSWKGKLEQIDDVCVVGIKL